MGTTSRSRGLIVRDDLLRGRFLAPADRVPSSKRGLSWPAPTVPRASCSARSLGGRRCRTTRPAYRHFADRSDLLGEIALRAMAMLVQAMQARLAQTPGVLGDVDPIWHHSAGR